MKKIFYFTIIINLLGCAVTEQNDGYDRDGGVDSAGIGYAYSPEDPVKVGAFVPEPKPHFNSNHIGYLSRLKGPNGESVTYKRLGSCCEFKSDLLPYGIGLLDKYEVSYEGLNEVKVIYINMYEYQDPKAPDGLILSK